MTTMFGTGFSLLWAEKKAATKGGRNRALRAAFMWLEDQHKFTRAVESASMRHDHNSSLWTSAAPRRRVWWRRLAFAGVASVVTVIAASSLRDHVLTQPAVACTQAWPYLDAGCGDRASAADLKTRPVRVIGIDRNAPAVVAKAAPMEATPPDVATPLVARPVVAEAGIENVAKSVEQPASVELPAPLPHQVSLPEPTGAATDGAGRETTVVTNPPPAVAVAPISEEDLTFRTGAAHRPGASVMVKEETAAPEPARKTAAKPRRTTTRQTVELPDGRRVTVTRGYREVQDPYGRRVRAADMGPRFEESPGGFFGARREPRGLGGLY